METDILVSFVSGSVDEFNNVFELNVPNPIPGKSYNLVALYNPLLYSADYISCVSEVIAYKRVPDDEPGLACPCTEDGTYGSFCAKHAITDDYPWCFTECDNAGLLSERTGRYYKRCSDYEVESTCDHATIVNGNPADLYYGSAKNLVDASRLPLDCGFAIQGTKGFWFKALGDDKTITVDTCPQQSPPSFSSTASVLVAAGETVCESLMCIDQRNISQQQRLPCGDKFATRLEFFGHKAVWYYIWIGPDGTPNFFFNPDLALVGDVFGVTIRGAASWNKPVQESIYLEDPADIVKTRFVYKPDAYEIVDGNCRKGYSLNVTKNAACGSLDPFCEPFIFSCNDIDECANPENLPCHRYASCTNTAGSFLCTCLPAYRGDGIEKCDSKAAFELTGIKDQKELADIVQKLSFLLDNANGRSAAERADNGIKSTARYLDVSAEEELPLWMARSGVANEEQFAFADDLPVTLSFPNIGFLGRGYDMFLGNPLSTQGVDPGYRLGVFKISFGLGSTTDGVFSIPKLVTATREPYTSFDSTSRVITSESEYQESATEGFELEVSAGFEYEGAFTLSAEASFSLNKEHEKTMETISKSESVFVQIVGQTVAYRARLEDKTPADVTDAFAEYVFNLDPSCEYKTGTFVPKCAEEEEEKYQRVIELFGTHYTTSVTMGGKAFDRYTLSANEMEKIQTQVASSSMGLSVSAAAEYSSFSGFVKTSGQVTSQLSSTARSLLKTQSTTRNQWFLGGDPGMGDGESASLESLKNWAATVPAKPVPISVSLMPLPALLTSKQFPNDPLIEKKQRHLFAVLYNVCNRKGGDNCAQFLSRESVDESDPDLIRFGDFIEIESLSYPGLATGVSAQLVQGSRRTDPSTNTPYFPIELTRVSHDPLTGLASIVTGSVVRSAQLISDSDKCYCDVSKLKSKLTLSFFVQESSNTDATMSVYITFKNDQDGTTTETLFYSFVDGELEDDSTNRYKSGYSSVHLGALIDKIRVELVTGDQVIINQFTILWLGRTFTFGSQVSSSSPTSVTLTASIPSGTLINLCDSLEASFVGDSTSAAQCQSSCESLAVPTAGSKTCVAFAFFESPNRCVLSQDLSTEFDPTVPENVQGKTRLVCSAFDVPTNVPSRYASTRGGRYSFIDTDSASLVKFQILSPLSIYNEARRIVRYGDTFILASSGGGICIKDGTSSLLSAEAMVTVSAAFGLEYKNPDTLNFVNFRLLSPEIAVGQPLRQTDTDLLFEIKSGYFSILFNQPQVIILGINSIADTLVPVAMRSVNDFGNAKFRMARIPVHLMAPSSEQFGNYLLHPQMEITIERIENTWLWLNITLPANVKGPNGRNVLIGDFYGYLSDVGTGSNQALATSITPFQSTTSERARNVFNLRFDFATNVVPNKQITVSLGSTIKSIGDFPKPVDPKTIPIVDDRPDVAVGRFMFVDDLETTTLKGQIFFKVHVITDDDEEIESTSDNPLNGRFSVIDGNGKTVPCNTQWDSPNGRVLNVECTSIPSGQEDDIVFRLFFPCTLQFVLPSGETENYCKDYSKTQEDFVLRPFLKTMPLPQARAVRILFEDSYADFDGTNILAPGLSDFSVSGSFNKVILNACTTASGCAPGISSLDISGVSDTTRFALNDPCSKMIWTKDTNLFRPVCIENSSQSSFYSQTLKIYTP